MTDESTLRGSGDVPPPQSESPSRRWNWWLAGRSSRREYWFYVGLFFLLSFALARLPLAVGLSASLAMIFVQARRIHDFGRTGWWAAVTPVVSLPLERVVSPTIAMLISLGIGLTMLIVIGVIPGEAGDNRFGPPPPVTLKRMLTGR